MLSSECTAMASRGMPAAVRRSPTFAGSSAMVTYAASHAWLNFMRRSPGKLGQEAQVVLVEQADVVDAMLQHGDPLDPEPEREAGVTLRVVADLLEHRRVDHARAAHLDEARSLAPAAPGAVAENAGDVVLGARLDEREVGRAQSQLQVPPENPGAEVFERPLQVSEGDPLGDHQALDLVEERRVRDVGVAAETPAKRHHLDRRGGRSSLARVERGGGAAAGAAPPR